MAKVVCPAGERHIADTRLRSFDQGLEPTVSQYTRNQALQSHQRVQHDTEGLIA